MFIGHFGAGLAGKGIRSRLSLGTMFMASQFIDLIWPLFVLTGIERVAIEPGNTAFTPLNFIYYPFSHSLLGVAIWAVLFGAAYYMIKKDTRSSLLLAALVLSHWVLDLLTHRPDLPLVPWSDFKAGLGLWNSVAYTVIVEVSIFASGIYLYINSTRRINMKGTILIWSLIAFLMIIYVMNIFSPPPPNVEAIGYAGLLQWLFVGWGYWADRNRKAVKDYKSGNRQPVTEGKSVQPGKP